MEIIIFLAVVVAVAWFGSQVIFKRLNKAQNRINNLFIQNHKEVHPAAIFTVAQNEEEDLPDFQPLLTKSVEHKQAKEWNDALSCLDQAYQLAAGFPAEYCEGAYLRLPYYLQLAGKNDEAWRWLNNLSNGVVPHRGDQPCGLENNIFWRLKVEDKKRLFLEKEKRFKEALRWRCTSIYLSAVTQFKLAKELPDGESRAIPYGIPALTETLAKPVEKANLKPELAEKLASRLFFNASNVKSDTHALVEFINVATEISDLIKLYSETQDDYERKSNLQQLQTKSVEDKQANELNENAFSNRGRKIVKTISGRMLWEEGYGTGENQGMSSPVPRWFVDFRSEGRLRVNCMTQATLYFRDDGHLFSVNKQWWPTKPLENANIEDTEGFWENVYKSEKVSVNYDEIWEACEYVPDPDCPDKHNIWRVAAGCRRSGRFFYTAKRKTAKQYLEGPDENIRWIYSEIFDQFTEAYEERYQKRINDTTIRRMEAEEYSRKHTKTFEFNFNFNDFIAERPTIDHYAVLGISREAGPREAKQAYWNLARQYHPDLNPNDSAAEEKFKCISVSYQEIMKQFGN